MITVIEEMVFLGRTIYIGSNNTMVDTANSDCFVIKQLYKKEKMMTMQGKIIFSYKIESHTVHS